MSEADYEEGRRQVWRQLLQECLKNLDLSEAQLEGLRWLQEREAALVELRAVCGDFGDNDWPNDLHLADVISGHLTSHLEDNLSTATSFPAT